MTPAFTPDESPWSDRRFRAIRSEAERSSFEVDRDRIVHCSSFRELQYKTQVQGLLHAEWPRRFRTRLNHVLEVAQIGRGLARGIGSSEVLSEAIALAHDLGHPPFGHAGERALDAELRERGYSGWNANIHSLQVVDETEEVFVDFRGLDLTWATREGIARHSTPFDEPESLGEFARTPNGGLECQLIDLADVFAYLSHDLNDALAGGYITLADVAAADEVVAGLVEAATKRWEQRPPDVWPEEESGVLISEWLRAVLVHRMLNDAIEKTRATLAETDIADPAGVRRSERRLASSSTRYARVVRSLLALLGQHYYSSPQVVESDTRARQLIHALFEALIEEPSQIPRRFLVGDDVYAVAAYVASLNDHTALALAQRLELESAGL